MGDRQPPFSMVPPNYPPGAQAAAQQRIYQFQAQQYLARRQQQQQQQQQQGGMELLGGQGAHQTDFARNNSLAHMGLGGQPQPPGAIGANFGVPRPDQVNGANNQGQPGQQPQPPQQHPGLASFGGAGGFVFPPPGGPNGTAGLQNAMAAHVQNPALMQQMAHAGGLAVAGAGIPGGAPGVGGGAGADQMRQLNMIGAARQQLPQQGLPGRLAAAGVAQQMALQQFQQAGAGANGPPGTNPMFPGGHPANGLEGHMAGMGQLGGHLGQQAGAGMMNPMGGVPGNPSIARPSMEQLKQFMQTTRNDMKMLETELAALPSTRGERSEAEINARAATLRNQLLQKRAHLGKIVNFIQATHGRGALGGQPGASDTTASPRMQPQGSTPAPTNGAWIGSPALNPTGTPFQGHAHLSPAMGAMAPQPGQNAPGSGMQPGPLDSNAMLLRPPSRPVSGMNPAIASAPRLGGTMPLGMPGRLGMIPGVGGEQVTQGAQAQHPGAMAGLPGQQMTVPPLERSKFFASFGSYLKSRNQTLDQRLIGDRQIDPYQLHVEVMKAGGFAVVEQNDLWPVIGGKLGIVQFPANSSDPAKSAPAAANAIAHLYKEYFAGFEEIYRLSLNQARPGATHPGGQNGLPGASINGSGQQLLSRLQPGFDLQKLLEFASLTSDEMRQRRMPEGLIATVEAQRPTLLRLQKDHENFRHRVGVANGVISTGPNQAQGLQQGQQGQPPQQPNMVPHAQGPGAMQPGMPGTNPAGILRPGQAHSPTPSMAGIPGMQGQMPTAMSGMVGMPSQPQPGQMPSGQQPMPGSQQLTRPPNAMGMHPGMLGASMMPQSQAVQNYLKAYPQELFVRLSNMINAKKAAFNNARNISTLPLHNITQEQRPEYDRLLERLWRQSSDLDKKLPIFLISVTDANKQEEILHKFIPVIASIEHQRQLLVSGLNKFFLSMDIMKNMIGQVHNWYSGVLGHISTAIATKNAEQQRLQQGMPGVGPQPGMTNAQGPNAVHMPPTNMQHHSPGAAPQSAMSLGSGVNTMANPMVPQHTSPQPPTMPAQSRAPIALQPPPNPGQKKQQQAKSTASGTPAPSAPSPAPSTSAPTPATVAATPTPVASASSPMAQTPQQTATPLKSPKQKPTPKPKPRQIKGKPAPSSPIKTSASTPTLTEASSSAPASSTAAYTASPEVNHGRTLSTIKRQREDEDAASHSLLTAPTVDSAPSPKRIKTEWASTPDAMVEASLSNHEARAEVIKTDEDATAFFAQMQSLLTQAENGEDQTSLPDISASISQILKVVGGDSQAQVDAFGFGTLDDIGNSGSNGVAGGSANGLGPNPQDDFNAFFDFASFPESDPIGAATPDLVPSSSTNPSPESGAADTPKLAVTKVNGDSKHASSATAVTSAAAQSGSGLGIETPDDLLRLGAWGEIDGGEAAYFHNVDGWQWQGPMPTADWAVMQP